MAIYLKSRSLIILLVVALLPAGCATVPEYTDPLAGISDASKAERPLAKIHLGVVYSENSRKALQHIEENRQRWSSFGAGPGREERNPKLLENDIKEILYNRFGKVVFLQTIEEAGAADLNLIMVLDLRIVDKGVSFTKTIVELDTIFLGPDGNELTGISGVGEERVPYPARTVFRKTLNEALGQFQQNIDDSKKLIEFARKVPAKAAKRGLAPATLEGERLAVLDLEAIGVGDAVAFALSDYLRDTLQTQGGFEVLSRSDLEAIARRTSLQQQAGDCVDASCLIQFGKALGTKYMVAGSVSRLGNAYSISLRLLDTEGDNPGVKKRANAICQCPEEELFGKVDEAVRGLIN